MGPMRAWGLPFAAVLLVVSCHQYRMSPKPAPPPSPSAGTSGRARAPLPEWLPASRSAADTLAPTPSNPDGGALVSGQRIVLGGAAATQRAAPPLVGGTRVPRHMGGGFLFWSANALYFAWTFLADLEPVVALDAAVDRVSFASSYVLVHSASGARQALSWPGRKRIALPVAGLIDAASLADGRSVLFVEPDVVVSLGAGQKAWRDVSDSARPVTGLVAGDGELWLRRANGSALRLEADGSLSSHRTLPEELTRPKKLLDPRWPASVGEEPLARAVRRGVPLDEHTALVEVAGALARVDLASGALLGMSPALLASARDCELLPVEADVLALCRTSQGTDVVLSGVNGPSPRLERQFARSGTFYAGSNGTLLFAGPCEARAVTAPAVCVRQRDGSWRELTSPASAAAADAGTPARALNIGRWVPTRDGGAIGLVSGENAGLYDPATGKLTRFESDQHQTQYALFSAQSGLLSDEVGQTDDGRIVGYVGNGSSTLHADGRVEPSPQSFRALKSAGPLALAVDGENRFWQSADFGQHWVEVARPPGSDARQALYPERCSRVGCEASGWYRLGYRKSPPKPSLVNEAPRPALAPPGKRPRLSCERSSPPRTRWVTRARSTDGVLSEEFDFGARKLAAREGALGTISLGFEAMADELLLGATLFERAAEDTAAPGFAAALRRPRVLRFVDPLGEARVVDTRFSWQEIFTRAAQTSSEPPSALGEDRRSVIPVLAEKTDGASGLLVQDPSGVYLWARPGQAARVVSLGSENAAFSAKSALVRGKDELVVLSEDDACAARVVSVTTAGARTLLELPQRPSRRACPVNDDALGLGDDGSLSVIRLPSLEPPSPDDPALLLRPGQKPVSLAPWAALGACPAGGTGARALIAVPRSWVTLEAPALGGDGETFTLAVVRWSEAGLCAEAIAVGAAPVELGGQEIATMVLARFGATPRADRRGFALGAEHSEDLTCKLVGP
ncbi:MAG: hypothetical protein AMXMBFR56_33180 [Polyangiaceae bacterium]